MKAIAIIPARYQSSRFPGKPLENIGGTPMLRHVYDNVLKSGLFKRIIIATDDSRIAEAAKSWDAVCMMTGSHHPSGTDRCAEIVDNIAENFDIVVNIQGDEPFINKKPLEQLLHIFESNPKAGIGTLVQKIKDEADIWDANTAKVVRSATGTAIYFSRSPIPFVRSVDQSQWLSHHTFFKHIGLYAYKPEVLKQIVKLPIGTLEKAESLEQLRWLENGYTIYVADTEYKMLSVDTPEDLVKAENFFNNNGSL